MTMTGPKRIIMDGNGRWGLKNKTRNFGIQELNLHRVIEASLKKKSI